uniref:Uncharacterized protein n=1 Tax=Mus spicilegus TaxID=10103 RepID=A0A8C6GME4_MUSSI
MTLYLGPACCCVSGISLCASFLGRDSALPQPSVLMAFPTLLVHPMMPLRQPLLRMGLSSARALWERFSSLFSLTLSSLILLVESMQGTLMARMWCWSCVGVIWFGSKSRPCTLDLLPALCLTFWT